MTGTEFMEKLLVAYQSAFDITRPYDVNGDRYDAYAAFNVTSAKYVLVKKAELWRANCFEHTFFACRNTVTAEELKKFGDDIVTYIEPELVRGGEDCTPQHHMYTYITAIFICEDGIADEVEKAVKKFKFFKNYRMGIRGYAEARVVIFDMKNHRILGNRAAKDLVKGYTKAGIP